MCSFVEAPVTSTKPQRIRSVNLAHSSDSCDRPLPKHQNVPADSVFQSILGEVPRKLSQALYPEPPSKSVCNDVMIRLVNAMKERNSPTYKDILSLKSEIPELFKDIPPANVLHLCSLQTVPGIRYR